MRDCRHRRDTMSFHDGFSTGTQKVNNRHGSYTVTKAFTGTEGPSAPMVVAVSRFAFRSLCCGGGRGLVVDGFVTTDRRPSAKAFALQTGTYGVYATDKREGQSETSRPRGGGARA